MRPGRAFLTTLALVALFVIYLAGTVRCAEQKETPAPAPPAPAASGAREYQFDKTISREVLDNDMSRSISMEGLLNGRGDLEDNIRMLESIGAKFVGRSLCLWGGEANLPRNLERAKALLPKVRKADPEMILQACVFEIVSRQVEQLPVPDWVFVALGQPAEKRNFRYFANTPSPSVPDGLGDEEGIRAIWTAEAAASK